MRKGRDGGTGKKTGKKREEKTDENSGHYVIASSRPPDRRPLERRTLAPIQRMCGGEDAKITVLSTFMVVVVGGGSYRPIRT